MKPNRIEIVGHRFEKGGKQVGLPQLACPEGGGGERHAEGGGKRSFPAVDHLVVRFGRKGHF